MKAFPFIILIAMVSPSAFAALECHDKSVDELKLMNQDELTYEYCLDAAKARSNQSRLKFKDTMSGREFDEYNSSASDCYAIANRVNLVHRQVFSSEIAQAKCEALEHPGVQSRSNAVSSGQSKEQQIRDLQQHNLPYDEYQRRYRQIMGQ